MAENLSLIHISEELQIPTEYPASISMMNRLKIYQDQARDLLNLTNTTMAYKARDAYTGIVNRVAALANDEEYRKILGKNACLLYTSSVFFYCIICRNRAKALSVRNDRRALMMAGQRM